MGLQASCAGVALRGLPLLAVATTAVRALLLLLLLLCCKPGRDHRCHFCCLHSFLARHSRGAH